MKEFTTRPCGHCGQPFTTWRADRRFCSKECGINWWRSHAAAHHFTAKRCKNPECRKRFSSLTYTERKYCSKRCWDQHRAAHKDFRHNESESCAVCHKMKLRDPIGVMDEHFWCVCDRELAHDKHVFYLAPARARVGHNAEAPKGVRHVETEAA